jgi:membrane protease YdiL (CAAX protease family)
MTGIRATFGAMWWRLSLLGLIGATSMILAPLEQIAPTDMPWLLLRLLSVLQPAVLILAFAALGLWAAPKLGLDAPVVRAWAEGRPILPALRPQLPPAIGAGLAVAAVLVLFWMGVRALPAASPLLTFEMPLATKLLYGGIVEELLLRWGIMSLFVWIAWRLAGRGAPVPSWCFWAGMTAAALLFAAGHLPMLYLLLPEPPGALILMVLAANTVPGLLFGWLFWRRGLEAAMIAHAFAHLFGTIALATF